jgi:hypothetical protein
MTRIIRSALAGLTPAILATADLSSSPPERRWATTRSVLDTEANRLDSDHTMRSVKDRAIRQGSQLQIALAASRLIPQNQLVTNEAGTELGTKGLIKMAAVQVTCIVKKDPSSRYEGILQIGGPGGGGWRMSVRDAIASIKAGTNTFYTLVNGNRADIAVVEGGASPYLRTHADGQYNDNLLALPQCPGA